MELKKYKIGDLVQVTRGASLGGEFYATQGNYVRLTCGNFDYRNNCFKENQSKDNIYYTGGFKEEFLLEKGDIITPLTEQAIGLLGSTARIPESGKYIQSQDIAKIDCNESLLDKDFAFYLISSACVKQQLSAAAQQTKIRHTSPDKIKECTVWIPSLDIQKRIGRILTDIDNKIAINRQINDNLEQQAQALFKSWFVDNSNPNLEETSLSEVASFVGGYSYTGEELTDCSNIAMATIKNFGRNGGFKADGFKGINPSAKLKECHYANLFDILVAHTDLTQNADVIGNAELLLTCGKYDSIIFSMDLVKVLPKETFPYRFLLAAMLRNKLFKGHSLGYVNGTTVLHLSKKALPDFEIRKPSDSESKMMDEVLASYYKRMAELLQENDRLISLRDTLLPKLMSGELKINDLNS